MKRLFRLRSILLVVMLSVLLLPLALLYFFRFYENELLRKTELELITQSAVFSAIYRDFIGQNQLSPQGHYTPVAPQLDLSRHRILPRRAAANTVTVYPADYETARLIGQKMQNILLNTQQYTLAGIRILDERGIVIAGSAELGQSLAHIAEVQTALTGRYAAVLRERVSDDPPPPLESISRGAGIRVFTAFPIMNQQQALGVVYLSRTPQNIIKYLFKIRYKVFWLLLVLLGLTLLIVLFISSRLSRPIRELLEQTRKLSRGEVETIDVLRQPGSFELAQLSASFSEMSKVLRQRSRYIQQFAAHVSHEFKTPLTSMQGVLELLREHNQNMPEAQRQRFLDNLQGDTERLKKLVKRLLEQGRADALHAGGETINILQALENFQQHSPLPIQIESPSACRQVFIAADAFELVLSNLADNSRQHGATGIRMTLRQARQELVLAFQDNGAGVSEANRQRIFTPFFTTRRESGGTGLGLGIIASTLKVWGGSIQLMPSESGALFEIRLKCADFA